MKYCVVAKNQSMFFESDHNCKKPLNMPLIILLYLFLRSECCVNHQHRIVILRHCFLLTHHRYHFVLGITHGIEFSKFNYFSLRLIEIWYWFNSKYIFKKKSKLKFA